MSNASRGARKIKIWGDDINKDHHRPGGYYAPHIKDKEDPYEGLSPRQRKIKKKEKPLNDWTRGVG